MRRETVRKTTQARPGKMEPTEGDRPSRKAMADIGSITKGSAGVPKAEKGRGRSGRDAGTTKEYQTTSTGSPEIPVSKSFLNKLGEMHTAERELTLALPLVAAAAKSKDLKTVLRIHLKETKGHAKALENIAKSLRQELPSKSCKPMTRLIAEGVKVIGKRLVSSDQDAALIAVGQKIEQFEISSYTPLCTEADENDWTHEFAVLTSILNQEKMASELLAGLAAGKAPLQDLVEKTSLKKIRAGTR